MTTTVTRHAIRSITAVLVGATKRAGSATILGYGIMVFALCIISFTPLLARDYGQYESVSPTTRAWIEGLTDHRGTPCCATADGLIPDAWEIKNHHYRVEVNGAWAVVPDAAVVKGPNKLGHAIVWIEEGEMYWGIRCFLPGPEV